MIKSPHILKAYHSSIHLWIRCYRQVCLFDVYYPNLILYIYIIYIYITNLQVIVLQTINIIETIIYITSQSNFYSKNRDNLIDNKSLILRGHIIRVSRKTSYFPKGNQPVTHVNTEYENVHKVQTAQKLNIITKQ